MKIIYLQNSQKCMYRATFTIMIFYIYLLLSNVYLYYYLIYILWYLLKFNIFPKLTNLIFYKYPIKNLAKIINFKLNIIFFVFIKKSKQEWYQVYILIVQIQIIQKNKLIIFVKMNNVLTIILFVHYVLLQYISNIN